MKDFNKTRSIKEPLLGGSDGDEEKMNVYQGYNSDALEYEEEQYDHVDFEGGTTPIGTPRAASKGRRSSRDFDPRKSQLGRLDMHLFRYVRQRKFNVEINSDDSEEAADKRMNAALADMAGSKKTLRRLSSINKVCLPKGEVDDSGSFNMLVDSQFSKMNPSKVRFQAIQMRPVPKNMIQECNSSQNSEDHDCVNHLGAQEQQEEPDELDLPEEIQFDKLVQRRRKSTLKKNSSLMYDDMLPKSKSESHGLIIGAQELNEEVDAEELAKQQIQKETIQRNKDKIERFLKDKPFERLIHNIHQVLSQKVAETEKSIQEDPNFLEILCPDGHLLEKTNIQPKSQKPKCHHCQQPHIDAHEFYYRCSDPSHLECEEKLNFFALCRTCAHCYNEGPGRKLHKRIHKGFHEHTLFRHPIKNRKQWTCHTQSPVFMKYCQDLHDVKYGINIDKKYEHPSCLSEIKGVVQDQTKMQGFECRVCDFDICLNCCLFYFDHQTVEVAREEEIRKLRAFEKDEDYEPFSEEVIKKKMHDRQHEQANAQIAQWKREKTLEEKSIAIIRTNTQQEDFDAINMQKPEIIFKNFQDQYVENVVADSVFKNNILIRGYAVQDEDKELGIIDDLTKVLEGIPETCHIFKIERKQVMMISRAESLRAFMVIKTVESFNEDETGKRNLIKTLRIIDPQLGYRCVKTILLEQITSYKFDDIIACNHTSVLQNDKEFTIYFYRRIKIDQVATMRLYKLDLLKNELSPLEGYDIIEQNEDKQWHVIFANKFGYQEKLKDPEFGWQQAPKSDQDEKKLKGDDKFLQDNYILMQHYFPQITQEAQKQLDDIKEKEEADKREKAKQALKDGEEEGKEEGKEDEQAEVKVEEQDDDAFQKFFKIVKLDDMEKTITEVQKLESDFPVSQFFWMSEKVREDLFDEKTTIERKELGLSVKPIKYQHNHFIIMNETQHHVDFRLPADPKNHFYPKDFKEDETLTGKFYPKLYEGTKGFQKNINDGAEIQSIEVREGETQYYLITEKNEIILVHPNYLEENEREKVHGLIKEKLIQDKLVEEGGKRVVIQSTFKKNPAESGTSMLCKNLNQDFFCAVKDTMRNYTESMSDYQDESFTDIATRLMVFKNPGMTVLIVNRSKENSPINIYSMRTDAVDNIVVKGGDFDTPALDAAFDQQISKYQKLVLEHINDLEKGSREKLWLNSKYTGIISQSHWIKTDSSTRKQLDDDDDLIIDDDEDKDKEEKAEEIEEKDMTAEQKAEKAKKEKADFAIYKKTHVYKEIEKCQMEMRSDLQENQFVFIEGNFGRYHRIKCIHERRDPQRKLKLVTYYTGETEIVFLFQWDHKPYFFIKKAIDDLIKYDATNNQTDSTLIISTTKVFFLEAYNKIKKIPFEELQKNQIYSHENVFIRTERVIDNMQQSEFFPMIAVERYSDKDNVDQATKGGLNFKNVYLSVFSIANMKITATVPINPTVEDMKYFKSNQDLTICRTSDVDTVKYDLRNQGWSFQQRQNTILEQNTRYSVFFYFQDLGRYLVKELMVHHKHQEGPRNARSLIKASSNVRFYGQKEILVKKEELDNFGFSKFDSIPFFDKEGKVHGCSLVIQGLDMNGNETTKADKRMQVINLLQDDYNNLIKYRSDIVEYGVQNFYNRRDCEWKKSQNQQFYKVISARMSEDFIRDACLDENDVLLILKEAIQMQLSMVEFRFEEQLFCTLDYFKRAEFFCAQEFMNGKSLCDVFICSETTLAAQFQKTIEEIQACDCHCIFDFLKGDTQRMELFKKLGKIRKTMIVSTDFNFVSQIERGAEMNATIAIKTFIDQILNKINSGDYNLIIMFVLTTLLQEDFITSILPYFARSSDEIQEAGEELQTFCNLENFFQDQRLPPKSDVEIENFQQPSFKDCNRQMEEIIDAIVKRDEAKNEKDGDIEKAITVEYSCMDFQWMIIGEKLRNYAKSVKKIEEIKNDKDNQELKETNPVAFQELINAVQSEQFVFDDHYLSGMMIQSSIDFYLQDAIQKIIDYQFETTYKFFKNLALLYILGFCVPLLIIIFENDPVYNKYCYIVGYFTQLIFFCIEIIQMRDQGLSYFQGFNMNDLIQFFLFNTLMFLQFKWPNDTSNSIPIILMLLTMITLAFVKMLFFMKIRSEYGFLVQMVILSFYDLFAFLGFFFLWIAFFAIQFKIIHFGYDKTQYTSLPSFVQLILQSFNNSIGNIALPTYDRYSNAARFQDYLCIYIMWILWFVQLFIMQIILLNFLIAVISQTYQRVISSQTNYTYKDKAEMNEECQLILNTLYYKGEVKMIVFTYDKSIFQSAGDAIGGMVDSIKSIVNGSNSTVRAKIDKFQKSFDLTLVGIKKTQTEMNQQLKDMVGTQLKINESAGGAVSGGGGGANMEQVEASIRNTKNLVMEEITKLTQMVKDLDAKDAAADGGQEEEALDY